MVRRVTRCECNQRGCQSRSPCLSNIEFTGESTRMREVSEKSKKVVPSDNHDGNLRSN
jgi:hypothetical protein